MPTNVQIPALGESISEATLIKWHKNDGDFVKTDEPLCELETDKANVDVPSPADGVIKRSKPEGAKVKIGETIATIDPSVTPDAKPAPAPAKPQAAQAPAAVTKSAAPTVPSTPARGRDDLSPAVRRLVDENELDASGIAASGPGGRLTKEDVLRYIAEQKSDGDGTQGGKMVRAVEARTAQAAPTATATPEGPVRREPMSKIRKKIAERLVQAQHTAAILTTFNEIDLQAVIDLRSKFKETFEKKYGVGLGCM